MRLRSGGTWTWALVALVVAPARAGPVERVPGPEAAPPVSTQDAFDAAVDLTRDGRFADALDVFAGVRAAGDRSPRLYFNLGVVHYRLGQLQDARDAFSVAARDPETADLAHYNLGLVAMADDDSDTAIRWFTLVGREAQSPELRQLADAALARVNASRSPPRGSLVLTRGRDSNVVLPVGSLADTPSSVHDGFWELRAGWAAPPIPDAPELEVHLAAYADEYDTVDEANVAVAEGGIEWHGPVLADFTASLTTIGDSPYQRSLDARVVTPLYSGNTLRLSLELEAAGIQSIAEGAEGLQGEQYAAAPVVDVWWLGGRWNLAWRHLWNEREADDLSPTQDAVSLRLRRGIGAWNVRAWARWVGSDYPTGRDDEATGFGIGLGWQVLPGLELLADLDRQENDSSESIYSYRTTRVTGGMRVRF